MKKLNPAWLFALCFVAVACSCCAQNETAISNFGSNPGLINAYQYVPANMPANAPLVLVLHGCTQTAASYSTETQWNNLADRHKFYVAYGEQTSSNNATECFNYFLSTDNSRGQGEALSLKQITDYMKAHYSIDTTRVFVTGISAGGAMTAVMCACYPDVFAAGAEMSGLPYDCATSEIGATYACLGQVTNTPQVWGNYVRAQNPGYTGQWPRMAIFQGSADETVNIVNSTEMMKQWTNVHNCSQTPGYSNSSFNGNNLIQLQQFFDSSYHVAVEFYEIMNMLHGTAVYPGSCYQQGGATDNLSFNENFYSPFWAAQFFGILTPATGLDSIIGPNIVSHNQQGITYSVTNTSGASYTWTVPPGVTIVSGQGTNSITVNWSAHNGTIAVTEVQSGGCEVGPVSTFVTAGNVPGGSLDAGVSNITSPAGTVCTSSVVPAFTLTNAGSDTIIRVTINYKIDGNLLAPYNWTGALLPSQSATVSLPSLNVTPGNHYLVIICSSPNSGTDINPVNDTTTITFAAGVTPVVYLGNDTTRCGGNVLLNCHNTGDTYAWSTGAVSQTDTAWQTGAYSVTVTSNGCSASGSINVTINPIPVVNLNGGNVCTSQLTLDAANSGSTYSWNNAATTQTISVTTSGTYAVTVTGEDNCSASSSAVVVLNPNPIVSLQLAPDSICDNTGSITLSGGQPTGGTFSGQYVSGGDFYAPVAGSYTITYSYTDNNNCSATATQNMVVSICNSIKSIEDNVDLSIFPNPDATGTVYLQINRFVPGLKAGIYDTWGNLMNEKPVGGENTYFDISELSPGIYIVNLEGNGISARRKLVVQ